MRTFIIGFLFGLFTVLVSVKYSLAQSESVDLTLVSGTIGLEVVEASITKLSVLQGIFKNDFGFLKRIALVESNYGTNQSLKTPLGGIWQISREMHQYVTNHQDFNSDLQDAAEMIGTITEEPSTYNASVPIWSAFLARLFLKFQATDNGMSLPRNISGQASWWSTYYNSNGIKDRFVEEVETYEKANRCNASILDLFFLVDHSSSLSKEEFNSSLQFVSQLSSRFPISSHQVRTGLILFSNRIEFISRFNQNQSNADFDNVINGIPIKKHRGTKAGQALKRVFERGFQVYSGARPTYEGVPRILVMLTDGISQDNVTIPTKNLKAAGVTIFAIGIGDGVDNDQLNLIASDPDTEYAYTFDNFDNLVSVFGDRLTRLSCEVPRIIPNDTAVDIRLYPGSLTYAVVKMSRVGRLGDLYITLSTSAQDAAGRMFLSYSFPNPNTALHDLLLSINTGTKTTHIEPPEATKRRNSSQVYITFMPTGTAPFEAQIKVVGSEVGSIATPAPRRQRPRRTSKPETTTPSATTSPSTKPTVKETRQTTKEYQTKSVSSQPAAAVSAAFKPTEEVAGTTDGYQTEMTKEAKDPSSISNAVVGSEIPRKSNSSVTASMYTNVTVEDSGSGTVSVLSPILELLICTIVVLWVS